MGGPKKGLNVQCNAYLVPRFGRGCVSRAFDDALNCPLLLLLAGEEDECGPVLVRP